MTPGTPAPRDGGGTGHEPRVMIITSHYPYGQGEQFLEAEMAVWQREYSGPLVIMPASATGRQRTIPPGAEISSMLSDAYRSPFQKALHLVSAGFRMAFWKELAVLRRRGRLTAITAFNALKAVAHLSLSEAALGREFRRRGEPSVIYTYWFGYQTYAATRFGSRIRVVTRAHRSDLYEDRRPDRHMYLRRQFIDRVHRIFAISDDGVAHLRDTFRAAGNVGLSRLGVMIPKKLTPPSPVGSISIVSVSFCVPVKNVDRIIDAIGIVAERRPDAKLAWRHIGDGPLRSALEARAERVFAGTAVDWRFLGQIDNEDVLRYLDTHDIDLIVNASSSEGIPVSIMEAMARGIPAVATDVGGVSELVEQDNGVLLPEEAAGDTIAEAIASNIDRLKSAIVRSNAAKMAKRKFDGQANYRDFIKDVLSLSMSSDAPLG